MDKKTFNFGDDMIEGKIVMELLKDDPLELYGEVGEAMSAMVGAMIGFAMLPALTDMVNRHINGINFEDYGIDMID